MTRNEPICTFRTLLDCSAFEATPFLFFVGVSLFAVLFTALIAFEARKK
jgi:hypothetical protein